MNSNALFTFLKKINSPLTEDYIPTLSNKVIKNLKESLDTPKLLVPACHLLHKHVTERYDAETADVLLERLAEYNIIPKSIIKHDLSTVEGFMNAVDSVMSEMMVSGAGIGGAFFGGQTNAASNATGMAAPTGPARKEKKKVLRRFGSSKT